MAAVFRAAVGTRARPVFRSRTSCVCPYRSPQKLSFISARKCWQCSVIGIIFAIGCRSPFGKALACEAKANLHPLAFYTIEFTSPEAQLAFPHFVPRGVILTAAVFRGGRKDPGRETELARWVALFQCSDGGVCNRFFPQSLKPAQMGQRRAGLATDRD